ncbi:ADP-ribosyltransferase [Streptomyces sp. NPDC058653]|uniref:ADP-ribosyltransferase n=1 Tax=Streptomyces sp. NPDC058653 TaxID=3346576 RepID=UPI00365CC5F4
MLDSQGLAIEVGMPQRRWELPRSLAATRILLYLMFALTVLGAFGVLSSLLELGSHITPALTLAALYATAPGVAAVILARRLWTGGKVVWLALIGLQAWLLVGSVVNLYGGSARGVSQLLLPGLLLGLVSVGASRTWFELPAEQRAVRPRWTSERLRRAVPSIPHMIGWRRNRGQSTVEYAGMVGVVALIIGALVLTGVGPQIANGLQTAVCNILGGECESDSVAGGGGESGGGESDGGGDNGGGGDSDGGDSDGGESDGGGDNGGGGDDGGSDGGGSDGGSDNGGSDGGGSDNGGSDGGGSDGGGSDGGGSDGGSDNGGSDGGGSDGGGSDGGGSDGGSDNGGSDNGGSDGGGSDGGGSDGGSDNGGSDNGGSDGGGSDGGGSDGGGSDGGGSDGGSDNGGSDNGGSDNGGSDNGGSDGGGSDGGGSDGGGSDGGGSDGGGSDGGGSDGGGSDGGGSDGGGSSGGGSDGGSGGEDDDGVECNPVMAPWGITQHCTETGTGGSDGGGSDGGGSSGGGSDGGGSDGGGSDGGGSDGGGSDGGGSDGGGSDGGGSSGGGSDGGSDGGSENDNDGDDDGEEEVETVCNPVMAPWGMTQYCTERPKPDDDKDKDKDDTKDEDDKDKDKDDNDEDDKDKDDQDDKKDDCENTNVAYFGPVTTGAAGDGRYTLASAGTRNPVVFRAGGSGSVLLAAPGDNSAAEMAMSLSAGAMAGVDTYQDIENQISNALGLSDPPPPPVKDDPKDKPPTKPKPPHLKGCPVKNPMTALDDVPKYSEYDRKTWSEKVEEIAKKNPLTKDFTAEDALIVADYTGSWAEDANKYLRGQGIPGSRKNSVPKFIEKMDKALEHLPPVSGTFHRGTFMTDEMLERYANGEEIEMPEYLSTSTDPAKADRAAQNAKANGREGENVIMEITTDNGRNIDPLSRYEGAESEVLIPRGGKFVKTGESVKVIGGKEYKVIEVKQVP